MSEIIQDTISLSLSAEHTVTNKTVKNSNTPYNVATYYSGNAIAASAAGGAPPSDSLGNTSKLTLSANVVLARIHAMPSTHNILNSTFA